MSVNITRGFPLSFTSVTSISAKNCKIYTWVGYKVIFIFAIICLYLVSLFPAGTIRKQRGTSGERGSVGKRGTGMLTKLLLTDWPAPTYIKWMTSTTSYLLRRCDSYALLARLVAHFSLVHWAHAFLSQRQDAKRRNTQPDQKYQKIRGWRRHFSTSSDYICQMVVDLFLEYPQSVIKRI